MKTAVNQALALRRFAHQDLQLFGMYTLANMPLCALHHRQSFHHWMRQARVLLRAERTRV